MFQWLRRLRREVSPTASEMAADVFGVREPDTSLILAGRRDLSSFFYKERIGFTEDTWPYVIIGDFYWDSNPQGQREFSWFSWRRRMVINYQGPWLIVQVRLFRRHRPRLLFHNVPTELVASVDCFEGDFSLHVRTGPGWRQYLDVDIHAHELLLKIVAARLNYLWANGRTTGHTSFPEWGKTSFSERGKTTDCVWRNPDADVLEDLNALDRVVMKKIETMR